jgi:flagellar motor switch protein FliN/FliY
MADTPSPEPAAETPKTETPAPAPTAEASPAVAEAAPAAAEASPAVASAAPAAEAAPAALTAAATDPDAQALIDGLNKSAPAAEPAVAAAAPAAPSGAAEGGAADQAAVDELLKQASFEDPAAAAATVAAADAEPFNLPQFQQVMQDAQVSSIDLLRDVELDVKIELGRNRMLVEDVLKLAEGSVVELDKLAGDPVDVFVNERLVARGEVLVLNDNFCVRVNEIVAGAAEEGL